VRYRWWSFETNARDLWNRRRANEEERRTQMKLVDISWAQYGGGIMALIRYIYTYKRVHRYLVLVGGNVM